MGGFAEKADALDQCAVRRFCEKGPRPGAATRTGMDHHGHVDVVEMALGDELGLAEHEFDVASGDAGGALLDIDELLGRHRKRK